MNTTFARALRLSLLLAAICLCASQTATAQSSYSDMWLVEAVSPPTEGDELPPVDEVDSDYATLAGCGVTEGDYSDYSTYQSETRLQSPYGSVSAASGPVDYWSRADVSLTLNLSSPEEGDYMVETTHTQFTSGTHLREPGYGSHGSAAKHRGLSAGALAPRPGLFRWITRLFGGIRPFKQVYKYSSQLQVGTEIRYYYSLVCQRPNCRADTIRSFPSSKWGGFHPAYLVIRGVRLSLNLGFTTLYRCVGWISPSAYPEHC